VTLEERAKAAFAKGECDRESCPSKEAVLSRIEDGRADAMSAGPVLTIGDLTLMTHTAIHFHDRELGEAVRKVTLEGFGLRARESQAN